MIIHIFDKNDLGQNTYLCHDEKSREGAFIDAGCGAADMERILSIIREGSIAIKAILLTHGHFDHIAAAERIRALTNAIICCHEAEKRILEDPSLNFSYYMGKKLAITPDRLFQNGETIQVGGCTLKVLHTPGHTPGGVCLYDKNGGALFSGDVLFKESYGRVDLPLGSMTDLHRSICEILFALPDDTKVYPGHGPATTIGYEKLHNPML